MAACSRSDLISWKSFRANGTTKIAARSQAIFQVAESRLNLRLEREYLGYGNYLTEECFIYITTYEFDLLQKPGDNYLHLQLLYLFLVVHKYLGKVVIMARKPVGNCRACIVRLPPLLPRKKGSG